MKPKKIPQTDSIRELAEFWDTHDLTDFEDELEEVHDPVFQPGVTVPLTPKDAKVVNAIAKARGISPRALIHEWISEHIERLSKPAAKS